MPISPTRAGPNTSKVVNRATRFILGNTLGHGREAVVHEATVVMGGRVKNGVQRVRPVRFAHKSFFVPFTNLNANFRNPRKHVQVHLFLKRMNKKYGMGLRLLPTMRVIKYRGKWGILKTFIPLLDTHDFQQHGKKDFERDKKRQVRILMDMGIESIWKDVFFPMKDPQTGKYVAIINDYGTIIPPNEGIISRVSMLPGIRKLNGILTRFRSWNETK